MYHYTYRITNKKLNKHYYGARSCKCLPKEDLGIEYFSSSSDKEFISDQKANFKDYYYKIIYIFDTKKEAISLEIKLHQRFDVGINESFYNLSKQIHSGFDTTGIPKSDDWKEKVSKANKGKVTARNTLTGLVEVISKEEFRANDNLISINKGLKRSAETKKKQSDVNKGKTLTQSHRDKIGLKHKGKKVSEETKAKMRLAAQKREDKKRNLDVWDWKKVFYKGWCNPK